MRARLGIVALCVGCAGEVAPDPDIDSEPTRSTPTLGAVWAAPPSTLPADQSACAVIDDLQCTDGTGSRCSLWDAGEGAWATDVPPMTEQAFVFDRFYDRYHSPEGQAMDFEFTAPMLAGTPEEEWSLPGYHAGYDGIGDASGWTGTALWGASARYATTGTDADYSRLVDQAAAMALLYEVTGVPGLLARSHWAMLPEGAPEPAGHPDKSLSPFRIADGTSGHYHLPIPDDVLARLPAYYTEGVELEGVHYDTTPRAMSDASRDMYVRAMPGVIAAWDLLGDGARESAIRDVFRTELPATLNRMVKGRIYNLQENDDLREAVGGLVTGAGVTLEEGDIDLETVDEIIFYVMEQPHPDHMDLFEVEAPATPPTEFDPRYELDLADPAVIGDLLSFLARQQRQGEQPIAWVMYVGARASDLLFMTQWGLVAHYVTGEEVYLDFVDRLMAESEYWPIMRSYGALQLPRFCAPHYGPSIGYPSLHNLLARTDPTSEFWQALSEVAYQEALIAENEVRDDPFFGVLYHRMVDPDVDPGRDAYVAEMTALLATYGMNPDDKLEPDRNYPRRWLSEPDPSVEIETIAEGDPEWTICEDPVTILGIEIPAPRIDGEPSRSVDPLPLHMRIGGAFLWQMDPWMLERDYGGVGMDAQWPMLGMTVPYWIGRADGTITEGEGLALAWRPTGETCE